MDDESYARQLQAQFMAEDRSRSSNGSNNALHVPTDAQVDEDAALALRIQQQMDRISLSSNGGASQNQTRNRGSNREENKWADDHMTDEELAMMLNSMQDQKNLRTSEVTDDSFLSAEGIETILPSGFGDFPQEETKEPLCDSYTFENDVSIKPRKSEGLSAALAQQLHDEEFARMLDENEKKTSANGSEYLSDLPQDPRQAHEPRNQSIQSTTSNPEASDPRNQPSSREFPYHPSDSLRALDNIGITDMDMHGDEPSSNKKEKKKPFGMNLFGLRQRSNENSTNNDGRRKPLPIIPSIIDSIGGQKNDYGKNSNNSQCLSSPRQDNFTSSSTFMPKCDACGKIAMTYISALGKKYHARCFRCAGCNEVIDSSEPFAFIGETEKQPLHRGCYTELYGIKCSVCNEILVPNEDGRISYVKHPFFDKECMCPRHALNDEARRCTGCHRFEPQNNKFADLDDNNRCVCWSCCRTVIVDSDDAKPLWDQILNFFEIQLELPIWAGMRDIPILVVGSSTLTDRSEEENTYHGNKQIMTRGLCLSEHHIGKRFCIPKLRYNAMKSKFTAADAEGRGLTFFRIPDASKTNPNTNVTAILCLSGMPRDLAASILAHEATHAWIKMHPDYDATKPLPPFVEEGCCQLLAHLMLQEGLEPASKEKGADGGPSDEKLRQYFKFSIETDEDVVYGEGFRRAGILYADIGILALLSHIVLYRDFPNL